MANCLVKEYKSVVQNDNLPYFNKVVLNITTGLTDFSYRFKLCNSYTSSMHCTIEGDGNFLTWNGGTSLGKEVTMGVGGRTDIFISKGNYKLIIEGSSAITTLLGVLTAFGNINVFENYPIECCALAVSGNNSSIDVPLYSKWSNSLAELYLNGSGGNGQHKANLSDIATTYPNLEILYGYSNSKLVGDIASLNNLTSLRDVQIANGSGIYGNIEDLGALTNLTILAVFNKQTVGGTFEVLVAKWRGRGKSNGNIQVQAFDTSGKCTVTFNNQRLPNNDFSWKTLEWTSTTITFNGIEIQNSDIINS